MRLAGRVRSSFLLRGVVTGASLATVALVASAAGTACLPDPRGDYEDFKERTAHIQPEEPSTDASTTFDAKPPEEAVEGLYVGICVASLAARDPEQALRFYTETKYTPDGPGAETGKLTLTVTPMLGWDVGAKQPTSPATVSKAETRGETVTTEVPVGNGGRFTAVLGEVDPERGTPVIELVEEANSISGRAASIENTTLDGLFSAGDRFCSTLGGHLFVPYSFTFDPKENTCLFLKVNEGDPLPQVDSSEFVCNF